MRSNVASNRHMIVLIFFYLCLSTIIISTTNAKNDIPISEAILMDTREICDTSINFFEAKHFDKCKKLYQPTTQFNFTVKDSDLFFCLALWDRTWKVCTEFSNKIQHLSGQTILMNATVFDAEIDRMIESNMPEHTLDICKNFKAPSDRKFYEKTEKFVSQLMDAGNCISSCHYSEPSGLNPLCLAIFRVDKEIEKIKTALLHPEEKLFIDAIDVTSSPNSQDNFDNYGSNEAAVSSESRVPSYHLRDEIFSSENMDSEINDESDEENKHYDLAVDLEIWESDSVKSGNVNNNNSNLLFVLGLAVIGLLCLGYLSCSYKRRMEAKQQQAYRGLEPSLEYDEYFNHDVNKYEIFHQPTSIPVPK